MRVDTRTREVESEITTRRTRGGHRQEWKFWRQEVLSGLKNTFQGSWREEDDPAADTDEFAQDLAGSWRSCTAGWSIGGRVWDGTVCAIEIEERRRSRERRETEEV